MQKCIFLLVFFFFFFFFLDSNENYIDNENFLNYGSYLL